MKEYVIDTSVLMRSFFDHPDRPKVKAVLNAASKEQIKLFAPPVLWYEMFSVIVQNAKDIESASRDISRFKTIIKRGFIEIKKEEVAVEEALQVAFAKTSGQQGHIGTFDSYFH